MLEYRSPDSRALRWIAAFGRRQSTFLQLVAQNLLRDLDQAVEVRGEFKKFLVDSFTVVIGEPLPFLCRVHSCSSYIVTGLHSIDRYLSEPVNAPIMAEMKIRPIRDRNLE